MATYYLTSTNSSTYSSGTDFSKNLNSAPTPNGTITISLAKSGTNTDYAATTANTPSNTAWGTSGMTVIVNVTTANTSVTLSLVASRINNAGTTQVASVATAAQTLSAVGNYTFTIPSTNWGTGLATDLLALTFTFKNTKSTATATAAIATGTATYVTTSITDNTPANVAITGLRAYDSDNATVLSGGSSSTGAASGVHLDFDMYAPTETATSGIIFGAPSIEAEATGTSFTGTATAALPDVAYDGLWPIGTRSGPIVWDSIQKRFLQWGGEQGTATTQSATLYELRLSSGRGRWRPLSPTGTAPPGSYMGGLAFDAINNQLVVVFGYTTTDTNTLYYCSFASDPVNGAWTSRTPTGTAPAARSNITDSVVTDYTNNCAYVVFGWGASYYNGVYKLTFSSATPGGTWSALKADAATGSPTARRNASVKLDTVNNRLLSFGGNTGTVNLNDLWQFSLSTNTWTQLSPTGTLPGIRELQVMGYDPISQRAFMYGGWTSAAANIYNELWSLDTSTTNCSWTNLTPVDASGPYYTTGQFPLGKEGAVCAYDPDDKVLVIWGGVDTSNDPSNHQVQLIDPSEPTPYLYGLNMNDYMRPMDAPAYAYNPDRNEAMFAGGYSQMQDNATISTGGHVGDIFTYNATTNRWRVGLRGLKTFPYREGINLVYDTIQKRFLAWGGLWGNGGNVGFGPFNEVWELKANSAGDYNIRKMHPSGSLPALRWLGVAAFDATNNRMLISLGQDGGVHNFNDLWQLDLSSGDGTWSKLTPTGTAPAAAWQSGFCYDSTHQKLYIMGGCTSTADSTYSSQMMVLDTSTPNCSWSALANAPATQRGWSMSIDVANQKIFAFGGYNGTAVSNNAYIYDIASNTWSAAIAPVTLPAARRSAGTWFDPVNNCFMVSHGRPPSTAWFGDTWKFTPNYTTPTSSTWTNMTPHHAVGASISATGLANNTKYQWQAWAATSGHLAVPVASPNPDFTLGIVIVNVTFTQPGTSRIITNNLDYSDSALAVLPTTADGLSYAFTTADYSNVATNDASYTTSTANSGVLNAFLFRKQGSNNTSNITLSWTGQASIAPSTTAVTLQVYNYASSSWETVTTNTTAAAATDFTLTGTISTNIANYYDANYWVTARVYQ